MATCLHCPSWSVFERRSLSTAPASSAVRAVPYDVTRDLPVPVREESLSVRHPAYTSLRPLLPGHVVDHEKCECYSDGPVRADTVDFMPQQVPFQRLRDTLIQNDLQGCS